MTSNSTTGLASAWATATPNVTYSYTPISYAGNIYSANAFATNTDWTQWVESAEVRNGRNDSTAAVPGDWAELPDNDRGELTIDWSALGTITPEDMRVAGTVFYDPDDDTTDITPEEFNEIFEAAE